MMQEVYRRMVLEMDADLLLGEYGMQRAIPDRGARWFVRRLLRPDWRYLRAWWRARNRELRCIWLGHDWQLVRQDTGPRPHTSVECPRCGEEAARFNDRKPSMAG